MLKINTLLEDTSRFELKNKNGEVVFKSVPFKNESEIKATLQTLRSTNNKLKLFDRKTTHEGLFVFQLKNEQGQVIGSSEHYNSEAGMENGIQNIINSL